MTVLRLADAHLAFGHRALLDGVDLQLERGDRVALVGRNGTGKSSLLNVLNGTLEADEGTLWISDGLRVGHLPQEVPQDAGGTVYDTVAEGLGALGKALAQYHRLAGDETGADIDLQRLAGLQAKIEAEGGWNAGHRVDALLSQLGLPVDRPMAECSGGMRRLAMLARARVAEPDILLLDEPTNHLDIDAISALEDLLLGFAGAVVLVSHDRALMQRIATRIVELDRGRLRDFPGDYQTYLRRKSAMLEAEARADARSDKALAEEETWLRQGIKARRTRNEGRVRRLEQMRRARSQRVASQGQVALRIDRGAASGALVAELEGVCFGFDEPIVRNFSTTVMRGDRIGIIGPNGCGKSTLLSLLLGEIEPDQGTVTLGTRLEVAYFDQQRTKLRMQQSVRDNVVEGSDFIDIGGRKKHVVGYLGDFLFEPERINSPVKSLSGGERNRLLLARIFSQPANLLVLDEPTNDLDVETLELLEELIADYDGTLLLVSHDRAFLDAVVTSIIAFEPDGGLREYVGGYSDFLRQRKLVSPSEPQPGPGNSRKDDPAQPEGRGARSAKLGYQEQRELDELPERIHDLEHRLAALQAGVNAAEFYQQEQAPIRSALEELARVEAEVAAAYERWTVLEERAGDTV